jgi:hypothetical protein
VGRGGGAAAGGGGGGVGRGGGAAAGGGGAGRGGAAAGGAAFGGAPGGGPFGGCLGFPSGPSSSFACATTSGAPCACDGEQASCIAVRAVVASSTRRRFVMMILVSRKTLARSVVVQNLWGVGINSQPLGRIVAGYKRKTLLFRSRNELHAPRSFRIQRAFKSKHLLSPAACWARKGHRRYRRKSRKSTTARGLKCSLMFSRATTACCCASCRPRHNRARACRRCSLPAIDRARDARSPPRGARARRVHP